MDALNDANLQPGTGPARCLLLTAEGDLAFSAGSLVQARGEVAVGQELSQALRIFLGEYFLDVTEGLRWVEVLGRKPADTVAVESMVRQRLAAHPEVARVEALSTQLLPDTRALLVSYTVALRDGATLNGTAEV